MIRVSESGYWICDAPEDRPAGCSEGLAQWIVERMSRAPRAPIRDLGCGSGFYLAALARAGFTDLTGYEGQPLAEADRDFPNIVAHDLKFPLVIDRPGHVICLEVAEHIPQKYEDALLDNLGRACAPGCLLIMSWASQLAGLSHVNCLPIEEAYNRVSTRGFVMLHDDTQKARAVNHGGCSWFATNTMVLVKVRAS